MDLNNLNPLQNIDHWEDDLIKRYPENKNEKSQKEFKNKTVVISGPELFKIQDVLKIISEITGIKKIEYKSKFCFYFLIEASSKIFFIKFLKVMLLNFAISGTNDNEVIPGCVFVSSK